MKGQPLCSLGCPRPELEAHGSRLQLCLIVEKVLHLTIYIKLFQVMSIKEGVYNSYGLCQRDGFRTLILKS